jgi:serine/threonine protein kinase HipA of HipAB toxin-antitoxin module
MVFNVLTHNRDDHVKNFAFRLNEEGGWELAPAYDLVFAPGPEPSSAYLESLIGGQAVTYLPHDQR